MSSQASQRPLPPPPPDYQPPPRQVQRPVPQQVQQATAPPRRKNRAGQAIAILIILLLLFMLLFSPLGPMLLGPLMNNTYTASSSFTLSRTVEINVEQGEIQFACDLPVPKDYITSQGTAQDITYVDSLPPAIPISKYGGDWIEWTGGGSGSIEFAVSYQAEVNTIIWDIDSSNSGMASDIPPTMDYQLGNEWEVKDIDGNPTGEYKIWPDSPTIRNLAVSLTLESATVYDNVKSIYDYVRSNVAYQTLSGSDPKSCLDTLDDGYGDCDDQSILLISLCRAVDIPSWLAFGNLYDELRGEWGPHAWAEIYVPMAEGGAEEPVIDPANGEFMVRKCNRLEEWKSDGNGEHLDDYYHILSYNYTTTGNQPAPVVSLGESYAGSYTGSGTITGWVQSFFVPAKD